MSYDTFKSSSSSVHVHHSHHQLIIITFGVMAEEGEDFIVTEAFAVRDLVEDEVYQPSASSSPLPTPSSSTLSIAERNQAFLDSLNDSLNKRGNSEEEDCGSHIEDLNIFDRELVLMSTKDLNSLMKCRNVPKARQAQIK